MRRWLRANTWEPDDVLGGPGEAPEDRMARRYSYLVATTGSWPEAWRFGAAHPR